MIYFDNSATTKVSEKVIEKVNYIMRRGYGNPSSLHSFGFDAEKEIDAAKKSVAKCMRGVKADEIVFTSGGTEANNLAVFGSVSAYKR